MLITQAQVDAARRDLLVRPRSISRAEWPDFKIRPISEEWRYVGRVPAYKSAVANSAYIWRDSSAVDRFGSMPPSFAQRRYELRGAGLMLPTSAPDWATDPYRIWREADLAAVATGDPSAVAAWHVMMEIPPHIRPSLWRWLVTGFVATQFTDKGAAVAWAIHALEEEPGTWIVAPHSHLVVTARHWRHDSRHGRRHPAWLAGWADQKRAEFAWRRRCASAQDLARAGFMVNDQWPALR